MTNENIKALAITDAGYAVAYCDAATSKEELKEAVSNLERLYNSELKAYNAHQKMDPAAYSGVYVSTIRKRPCTEVHALKRTKKQYAESKMYCKTWTSLLG